MANVEAVREGMRRGDYYEVVLRQTFRTPYSGKASELFERVQRASPSPARQPEPVRIPATIRRGTVGGGIARDVRGGHRPRCSCGWKGIAWRRARSPERRRGPATHCATRTTSASCWCRRRKSRS
ncbi:hypothetical protein SBA4_1600026 [Candidatus Sulfopaludibacter sp. SbA4]|nr:hypothetical protein SBA4_1600026 [Candidatus Sulfopaludibacter sp. SbA4]